MTLDKRLAYLRKRERMSQAEVAERLDVSRQAVSRWESGDSKPSIENLQSLCKLYHMSLDQMFATDDDITSSVALMVSNEEKKQYRIYGGRKIIGLDGLHLELW